MKYIYTEELIKRIPELAPSEEAIKAAVKLIVDCHKNGGKILLAGSGGSAADCEHISGEFLKGFLLKRTPDGEELKLLSEAVGEETALMLQGGIRAIPLVSLTAVSTAFGNDVDPTLTFAQEVYALGQRGDVLIGISTSGNSKSVCLAAKVARAIGVSVISLTGEGGGILSEIADVKIKAPHKETYRIQEYHLPIYHAICADCENIIFGKTNQF
jgi:D-sedoheptulose 7-phosphate isomerase